MQTLLIILDGLCEAPQSVLGGRTPLEVANTPNMDFLASHGECFRASFCPEGFSPATDCCVLTMLGYKVKAGIPGRGAIEAVGLGIDVSENDLVYRCNFALISNGIISDVNFSPDTEAVRRLKDEFKRTGAEVYLTSPGHAITVIKEVIANEGNTGTILPLPNSIIGSGLPKYNNARLNDLTRLSYSILGNSALLFWGEGQLGELKPLPFTGALITGVNVMTGIGRLTGMKIISHPSFTGTSATNYELKAQSAIESVRSGNDLTILHIEAPDAVSHITSSARLKTSVIEEIDRRLIAHILNVIDTDPLFRDIHLILASDHFTDSLHGLHHPDPVPIVIYTPGDNNSTVPSAPVAFNERAFSRLPLTTSPLLKI